MYKDNSESPFTAEPQESNFCEMFTVDERTQSIIPSLPLLDHNIVWNHAKDYFIPGTYAHLSSFTKVAQAKQHILSSVGGAVGKVFIGDKAGTAFFVSPTILCTAGHVAYYPGSKKFTTQCGAASLEFVRPQDLYDVEEIGQEFIAQQLQEERRAMRVDVDPKRGEEYYSGAAVQHITQLDFGFLRTTNYQSPKYLFPLFLSKPNDIAVVSYPGSYDLMSLDRLINLHKVGHPSIYHAFCNLMGIKHVAPGTVIADNKRILCHSASTLRGSSGGPLIEPGTINFVGIHTEGWTDVNYNLAVSARHPAFKAAYNQFVRPTLDATGQILLDSMNS